MNKRSRRPVWQNPYTRWTALGLLWVVAFYLGISGFLLSAASADNLISPADAFYMTLQLILLESIDLPGAMNVRLEVARLLLPGLAAFSALDALLLLFRQQTAALHLRLIRRHVVICGLGHKGYYLARSFRRNGETVVVVERDENADYVEACRSLGAIVLFGDAAEEALLREAGTARARVLVAVCGDDGTNAEVAFTARRLCAGRRGALTCIIHVINPELCQLLRQHEIEASLPTFRLELFNIYDRAARVLLKEHPFPVPARRPPHLLVVGLGRMGENLVLQAALDWRKQPGTGAQLKVSVVDRQARQKSASLIVRYPQLERLCNLVPLEMDVRSPEFQQADFLRDDRGRAALEAVYVCLDNNSLGLQTGLLLGQRLAGTDIPILVRMTRLDGLAHLLEHSREVRPRIQAFGLLDRTCSAELVEGGIHEILARALHEEYLRWLRRQDQQPGENPAMLAWDELPEWLKERNRRQADHIREMLKKVGCGLRSGTLANESPFTFTQDEIEFLASLEHQRWLEELRQEGWRRAPGPRDPERRTHPNLVSWEGLPAAERQKVFHTLRQLPGLLAENGFQLFRIEPSSQLDQPGPD
jgi:hypothetical protein